jgi:hypothetical protein
VDEAEAALREHALWRYSYVPNGRISEVRRQWLCFSMNMPVRGVDVTNLYQRPMCRMTALQDEIRSELAVNKVFLQGCDKQASCCASCCLAVHLPSTDLLHGVSGMHCPSAHN